MADESRPDLSDADAGKSAGLELDARALDGSQSGGSQSAVQAESAELCKPDAAQSAEQSSVAPELADALVLSAARLQPDVVAELEAPQARSVQRVPKHSPAEVALPDLRALAEVVQPALLLPEPVAAQLEQPEAQLADAARRPTQELQVGVQLESAAGSAEPLASAPLVQLRPASPLVPEVQRASEEQPLRAEQQVASYREWPSARPQAWRYATGRSWF